MLYTVASWAKLSQMHGSLQVAQLQQECRAQEQLVHKLEAQLKLETGISSASPMQQSPVVAHSTDLQDSTQGLLLHAPWLCPAISFCITAADP